MNNSEPKYRRIYAALRHDILTGKYNADGKFPSEGTLMRKFGVSRITVRQAMADLKTEGFLEIRCGSGTYLSALARHATGMIGLVIPDYSSSPFFRRLGDELVRAGKDRGYTMLLSDIPGDTPAARAHEAVSIARVYARRKVAGVIIEPVELMPDSADLTREIISAFDALNIPVILIDREISTLERSGYDLVGMDNLKAGLMLGRHLIANGSKRIVFLMPPLSASTNIQRMLGLAGAAMEAGLDWSHDNIVYANTNDVKAVMKALATKKKTHIVVCHNDQTAASLPKSVKVAGFDALETKAKIDFPTVYHPVGKIAETAIAALLERIKRPDEPPRKILLEPRLVPLKGG
jgi:DNA-binding LacI/PurR family transcriptional regulator